MTTLTNKLDTYFGGNTIDECESLDYSFLADKPEGYIFTLQGDDYVDYCCYTEGGIVGVVDYGDGPEFFAVDLSKDFTFSGSSSGGNIEDFGPEAEKLLNKLVTLM